MKNRQNKLLSSINQFKIDKIKFNTKIVVQLKNLYTFVPMKTLFTNNWWWNFGQQNVGS